MYKKQGIRIEPLLSVFEIGRLSSMIVMSRIKVYSEV